MKQATQSSFNEGLLMDMNPLVTPQTCLSDCLNGTLITFNGNEFSLQNDSGNVLIKGGDLPNGFIPVGMKEYGGIIYTALLNPTTNACQIGSIPSPNYDKEPKNQPSKGVEISFEGSDKKRFKDSLTKLFEFEQLTLNPGDEYKIVYSADESNDINGIYNVNYIAIDESGKKYKLKSPNVVKTEEDEYKYFDQTIRAVLGLEVTLNSIDWFETSAYSYKNESGNFDIKLKVHGKNKIKNSDEGKAETSEDDLYIVGCKIEYNDKTEYVIDEPDEIDFQDLIVGNANEIFSGSVDINCNLPAEAEVSLTVTPFDRFRMLDELKRIMFLKMDQVQESGKLNEIFQYKYSSDNKFLRLDFNANLKGFNDVKLYLEFYDIWSDYSVIVPINDPNPFGQNTVFITTSDEKCDRAFNSKSRGGIATMHLTKNDDSSIYKPTLFNPNGDRLIRKNQILRENNLYIVKISIIEDSTTEPKYHNIYKVFTLNENMNEYYKEYQLSENPLFKDFTTLSQKKNELKVNCNYSKDNEKTEVSTSDDGLTLNTDGYYYKLVNLTKNESFNPGANQSSVKTITKTADYEIDLSIDKTDLAYGSIDSFKLDNVEITTLTKNIVETSSSIKSTTSVIEGGLKEGSTLSLKNTLTTTRTISPVIIDETRNVNSITSSKSVWDTMVKSKNDVASGYIKTWGNRHYPRRITLNNKTDDDSIIVHYGDSSLFGKPRVDDESIKFYLSDSRVKIDSGIDKSNDGFTSGGVFRWVDLPNSYNDPWGKEHDHWCKLQMKDSGESVNSNTTYNMIFLLNEDGNYYPVFTNNYSNAVDILKNIYASIVEPTKYKLYYYGDVKVDNTSTSYTKPRISISGSATAIFTQHCHYDGTDVDQNDILNKLNEIIGRSENTVNHSYISEESLKYLQVVNKKISVNSQIDLDKLEITEGVDEDALNKIKSSKGILESRESEKLNDSKIKSGEVWSDKYPTMAYRFSVNYSNKIYPVFKYAHVDLKKSRWAIRKRDPLEAFRIDTSIFDL